jgi:hypothetical protein
MADKVQSAREALPLWLASIPDPVTPVAGRDAAQAALDDADAVIANVQAKLGSTLPPMSALAPDVEKAIDDVKVARDGFDALADRAGPIKLTWPKTSGKYGPILVRVGTTLYQRLAELEGHAATSDSLPDLAKKLAAAAAPLKALSTLALLGLAYLAWREWRSVERLIEGT